MKILLTAPPAVGKSTVIARVVESYPDSAFGIVAREMLDTDKQRIGFTSVNGLGESAQFMWKEADPAKATIGGEYSVDVSAIDQFVVKELQKALLASDDALLYVDEIGRAQVQSKMFVETIRKVLKSPKNVLASIVYDDEPWSMEFKTRDDVCLLEVNVQNRSELPAILLAAFRASKIYNQLNKAQQKQVCTYLKQFVDSRNFDSARKLFDNALPYLLNGKIEATEKSNVFTIHGQTESHSLIYIEDESRFQCDCPLANGRVPFENRAATCSHEMSVVLNRLA